MGKRPLEFSTLGPAEHSRQPRANGSRSERAPSPVRIALQTPSVSYSIVVGSHLLPTLSRRLAGLTPGRSPRLFVISSPEIWELWSGRFLESFRGPSAPVPILVPAGESSKRLRTLERVLEHLAEAGADRDSMLLAFGGGIVGDITGFAAAVYMRGIPYVQLPTTLLAQVDSSVGGKTGVNLRAGKNLVGSFHHPLAVFADTDTLATLPARELRAGLQESVKAGIIRSPQLFRLLEREAEVILDPAHPGHVSAVTRVVVASIRIKAEVVEVDERESGLRMILNFGHTLGHAIEAATQYCQLLHGEAVGWGSIGALHLSRERGTLSTEEAARMEGTILRYGPLPRFQGSARQLVTLTSADKKMRSGTRSFVLPIGIGSVEIVRDVTDAELWRAAESMLELMRRQPEVSA